MLPRATASISQRLLLLNDSGTSAQVGGLATGLISHGPKCDPNK
jgi:hypothetical protein